MTSEERKASRAICEAATDDWFYDERIGCVAVYCGPKCECLSGVERNCIAYKHGTWVEGRWTISKQDCHNLRHIAHARQALPAALDALDEKDARIAELEARVKELEETLQCDAPELWAADVAEKELEGPKLSGRFRTCRYCGWSGPIEAFDYRHARACRRCTPHGKEPR